MLLYTGSKLVGFRHDLMQIISLTCQLPCTNIFVLYSIQLNKKKNSRIKSFFNIEKWLQSMQKSVGKANSKLEVYKFDFFQFSENFTILS